MRLALVIAALLAEQALGQTIPQVSEEGGTPTPFWKKLGYTLLLDTFGEAHLQNDETTQLRVFDSGARSLGLSYVKAGLWLDADPIGFRVDVGYGQTIDTLSSDTSVPVLRNFEQAYVSLKIPLHRGLTIDFGRHLTCAGNETVDSRQSWLYSRSLLFGYAAPFTHTGFRVSAPLTETLEVTAGVNQGWDVIIDNNAGKSFFGSVELNPGKKTSAWVSFFAGPELTGAAQPWRFLVDGVLVQKLVGELEAALNIDAALEGQTAWYGAALSAHVTLWKFDFAARLEAFNDPQNVRLKLLAAPGRGAWAWEVTASARATITNWVQVRAEYRHDVFLGQSAVQQDTVTVALVAGL